MARQAGKLRFQLRANPTKKKEGKRLGLQEPDEQMAWLRQKAAQHGFRVLGAQIVQCDVEKTQRPSGQMMVHLWVDFHGVLEVVDTEKFEDCLRSGIGSGKAFGFGLLMVSRN